MSGRRFYVNTLHKLRSLLNPALCLMCGIPTHGRTFLCAHCAASLPRVKSPCRRCGLPNHVDADNCPVCLLHPPRWDHMIAPLVFAGSTRDQILQFKFTGQLHVALALLTELKTEYQNHPVDVLLPVPLHPLKRIERGYNQAQEIARILSSLLHIRLDTKSLTRIRATTSQAGLSLDKRRRNLRGAFAYTPKHTYRRVAIIDDIITSGSTLDEICKPLKKGGVEHIEVWSLARTLKS